MPRASMYTFRFVEDLRAKFDPDGEWKNYLAVQGGITYDRIFVRAKEGPSGHVLCFVHKKTGGIYKPAGLTKVAPGERYLNRIIAAVYADEFGHFLYDSFEGLRSHHKDNPIDYEGQIIGRYDSVLLSIDDLSEGIFEVLNIGRYGSEGDWVVEVEIDGERFVYDAFDVTVVERKLV